MTAKNAGPQVVGKVDEASGAVSVGVIHEGQFLPVAEASLDYAKARGLSESGDVQESDDAKDEA